MASIWKRPLSVEILTQVRVDTTVDSRTRQSIGVLHGGIFVLLAETLGSCGAAWAAPDGHRAAGLEINANRLRSASEGWVTGTARPIHMGRGTHVWQIEVVGDQSRPTASATATAIVHRL